MKRNLYLPAALLLVFSLLLPLAACGKPAEPADAQVTTVEETEASTTTEPIDTEDITTAPEEITTEASTTEANPVPGTPAQVLTAYTEVMNKAKKDAKYFRKLEYQQLGKDSHFEQDFINNPAVMEQANKLMTSKDKAMTQDMYTKGVTDMVNELPVMKCAVGCMAKDTGVFARAAARQLSNGDIELTLVMKPEDNPEPAAAGASASPSITGQMFNPLSKAGIDERLNGTIVKMAFLGKPPVISTRYFDCKAVLTYNPETKQIVTLRQDYNVRINILEGKALIFINAVGYATLEAAMICDQFKY